MLEKVADSARKAVKLAELYNLVHIWRAIPRILLHFFIHIPNMHETYQKKYRILPIFLPTLSAKAYRERMLWLHEPGVRAIGYRFGQLVCEKFRPAKLITGHNLQCVQSNMAEQAVTCS